MEDEVENVGNKIDNFGNEIDNVGNEIDNFGNEIDDLEDEVEDVEDEMDDLKAEVQSLRSELQSGLANLKTEISNHQEELRNQLATFQKTTLPTLQELKDQLTVTTQQLTDDAHQGSQERMETKAALQTGITEVVKEVQSTCNSSSQSGARDRVSSCVRGSTRTSADSPNTGSPRVQFDYQIV